MYSALKAVSSDNTRAMCMIKDNYARVLRYTLHIAEKHDPFVCITALSNILIPVHKERYLRLWNIYNLYLLKMISLSNLRWHLLCTES